MTVQKVVLGGFGSNPYQMRSIARELGHFYQQEVIGIPFREAMGDPEALAMSVDRKQVITHSAGIIALHQALWRETDLHVETVTAVAPPIPTKVAKLVYGALRVAHNHVSDIVRYPVSSVGNVRNALSIVNEVGRNTARYSEVVPAISQFDCLTVAQQHETRGIPTQLIMMCRDEFFTPQDYHVHQAPQKGIDLRFVRGEHGDFIGRPGYVMKRVEQSNQTNPRLDGYFTSSEYDPQLQVPDARQTPAV